MTDNVTFQTATAATPASGTSIAADEVADGTLGTVKVQYVKLMDGTLDGTTKAAVGSAGLKVDGSGATQPVSGTVSAAQSGTWNITNISGTVSLPTGAATAAKQPALGVAGTASADVITVQGIASMTALKVDGSGVTQPVSGTVTAAQATAASLNATVVGTGTFAVQATQSGNWTARVVGNAGAVIDGVNTAATAPANGLLGLGIYNSTEPSPTTGQSVGVQLDSKGRQRTVLMDAAGNTRGANVNASSQLSVSVDAFSATNASTNVAQMNGVTVTMGNGVSGTGVQRVAIASDNTVLPGVGAGATGSAVPANASYAGGIAKTALPSAATDGNLTGVMTDKFGRPVTLVGTIRDLVGTQTTTISASTAETTIVTAGAAGVFNDLVMLIVSNTSTATNTRIDFRDTTAGSVLFSLQSNGGQPPIGFALPVPIPQTSSATNWTAQCATSTTDVRVYAVFAKNK